MALDPVNKDLDKTDTSKKRVLEALAEARGIVSTACHNANISRTTFYDWVNSDPGFKAAVEVVNESCIDWVESKLHEKINGITCVRYDNKGEEVVYEQPPSDTAIIFFLKTRAKKRGYVERQEISPVDPDGNAIKLNIIMPSGE